MNENHDKEKVLAAFGGVKGLIDTGIPSIVFLIAYNLHHEVKLAVIAAVATSLVLAIVRLVMKDTIQHALSGLLGVAISAGIALWTGNASDFFVFKIAINAAYATAYFIGNVTGWPILGLILGPILGENLNWRNVPARKAIYIKAGWLWVLLFVVRLTVQVPVYLNDSLNTLGVVSLVMGVPPYLLTGLGTWLIIKRVPLAIAPENKAD